MTAVTREWYDLLRELHEHPEWREELRRLVLTEELLNLPQAFQRLEAMVEQLVAAQRATEKRVEQLAAAQQATEKRVEQLAAAQRATEARMEEMAHSLKVLAGHVDHLRGWSLEARFQRHAPAYLSPLLRRVRALPPEELASLVEDAEDHGQVTEEEARGLVQADLVASGYLQNNRQQKVWVVVEVSWTVGEEDVDRAAQRAEALRKIVPEPVIPVVAGNHIGDATAAQAAMQRVYTLIGRTLTTPERYR